DRRARPTGKSGRRARPSSAADARAPSTRRPAPCSLDRTVPSHTRRGGGLTELRSRPRRLRCLRRAAGAGSVGTGLASQEPFDDLAPAIAEDGLAGLTLVGGPPACRDALRELGACGEPPDRLGECLRISGRDEQGALAVDEELPCSRGIGCYERRTARERLERLVRNDALRLAGRAEDPERAARLLELLRQRLVLDPRNAFHVRRRIQQQSFELATADDPKWDLGCKSGRLQARLDALQRDQLADEEDREARRRLSAWLEQSLFRPDEADRHFLEPRLLCEVATGGLGVGHDGLGAAKRVPTQRLEHPG